MRTPPKPRGTARKILLPNPTLMGSRRFWRRGSIRQFLAELEGKPAPAPQPDDEHLIQAKELRKELGNVSDMWLHRHLRRPDSES